VHAWTEHQPALGRLAEILVTVSAIDASQLLEVMGDAVIIADPHGVIVFWNAAATRLFGFEESEALGQSLSLITPQRLQHRHNVGFEQAMASGTTRYGTTLLKVPANHKDGQILSIAFTVAMLLDDAGKVSGVAAVIRDETQRFMEDRDLRKRLANYERLR
jgi:PAS domain S-box-containing protein